MLYPVFLGQWKLAQLFIFLQHCFNNVQDFGNTSVHQGAISLCPFRARKFGHQAKKAHSRIGLSLGSWLAGSSSKDLACPPKVS